MATNLEPGTILTQPPDVTFAKDGAAPAAPLYFAREDRLMLRVANSVTGIVVGIRGRIMRPDGVVVPFSNQFAPSAVRTLQTLADDLTEGFLLSACVVVESGTVKRGQCFAQLAIVRGSGASFDPTALLISDYLTSSQLLGWPGGVLRSSVEGPGFARVIVGTNPAVGIEISETCPTGARWRLHAIAFSMVTSAVVGNRLIGLVVDDGANIYFRSAPGATQAASLTFLYATGDGLSVSGTVNNVSFYPLPGWLLLPAGARFRTNTSALDAGDDFSAPVYQVEEWIEL